MLEPAARADNEMQAIVGQAERDGVRLIIARTPSDALTSITDLARAGFRHVEELVTLECDTANPPVADRPVSIALPADFDRVRAIASKAFTFDRLHADIEIDNTIAEKFKRAWIENSLAGRADAVLVVRRGGHVVGFNACLRRDDHAVIDLIATSADVHGRGFGRALVAGCLNYYSGMVAKIRVGTQAANTAAVGLYMALGFHEVEVAHTYHWTPPGSGRSA